MNVDICCVVSEGGGTCVPEVPPTTYRIRRLKSLACWKFLKDVDDRHSSLLWALERQRPTPSAPHFIYPKNYNHVRHCERTDDLTVLSYYRQCSAEERGNY